MIDVNGPQAQYDAEERCLKIARTAAKYEYTKNVIQKIIGDNFVEPTRSNTPLDFVIKDKNADMPVGGIEHFHVSLIYEGAEGNQRKSTAKKLQEEVAELLEAYTAKERSVLDCAEEMADVMEVLYAMGKTCAVSKREVEQVRSQKASEKGTFSKKIFLVSTEK